MAKQKKTAKKGDKKKISALDSALNQTLSADQEAYSTAPAKPQSVTNPAQAGGENPALPRRKYEKPVEFPRKVMALFTEGQYRELNDLKADLMKRDGKPHSLNSIIRDALARYIAEFRHGR